MSALKFAGRAERIKASPIREILSVSNRPGMISFAGGLPAADTFPEVDALSFEKGDLQYGPSEGESYLREYVAADLKKAGWQVSADQILILTGSQQGIDLVGKLFIEKGTKVAVASTTYLAALQVFSLYGADYVPFDVDSVNDAIAQTKPAILYANPTFQNPSSEVYTLQQRQSVAYACEENGSLLFEDDPYRELCYEPCERQPICSMTSHGSWVYQSTFSKTVAPGLRIGYLVCSADLYPKLLMLKQASDLHTSRVAQRLVMNILDNEDLAIRLEKLRHKYKAKRDVFDESLHKHFSHLAAWNKPSGGLFFWLTLNSDKNIDTRQLLGAAVESGVTFMPGEPFFADGRTASSCFRLNFSGASTDDYDEGLRRLAVIFEKQMLEC